MTFPTARPSTRRPLQAGADYALADLGSASVFAVFQRVAGSPRGLTERQAEARLREVGDNDALSITVRGPNPIDAVRSPFVALLAVVGVVFLVLGEWHGAATVALMVVLAVGLRIWQQTRSTRAGLALEDLVLTTTTVRRRATPEAEPIARDVPSRDLVPGDVVVVGAGDVVAADLRLLSTTDLVVDQAVLSGEVLPVPKSVPRQAPAPGRTGPAAVVDHSALCFAGTAVVSGTATGVVIATGDRTYGASLARAAGAARPESSVDVGVRAVGWTLVRCTMVLAPLVFVVSGLVGDEWARAGSFALAVVVGLTPEMLPVIVTANLARGAARLAGDRVLVRRLDAIQDLGAVDVLCVDKTGTLTENRVVHAHSVDVTGRPDDVVAEFAYLAAHFSDEPGTPLDEAMAEVAGGDAALDVLARAAYAKVGEIAFEPARGVGTVVVSRRHDEHVLICRGDADRMLALCDRVRVGGRVTELDDELRLRAAGMVDAVRRQGRRVVAVAVDYLPARWEPYGSRDEKRLILAGFASFEDPVRDSAAPAVASLAAHGVAVKMLTGDGPVVARQVAAQVGLDAATVVVGADVDAATDDDLRAMAAHSDVFAELAPSHKTRILAALRAGGHTVGFLGDGVNDVAALRLADAGIASDTATDAARYAADLVLLDEDLAVLARGVVEGRRTLANTMKYVKITASSNFGNVLSVVAASVLLPFLPILPIQLMVQNVLYDTAQVATAWDRVDDHAVTRPRRWQSGGLVSFMVVFGSLSSLFDLATFAALWWGFGGPAAPATFQTEWFVEGLCSQLLVVLVLRTSLPPWRDRGPARPVWLAAATVAAAGVLLAWSPLAGPLHLVPLPAAPLAALIGITVTYAVAAQLVKQHYVRRHPSWL